MKRFDSVVSMLGLTLVLLLTGCPDTGIVCKTGTNRCGNGCADYTTDLRNCGACGHPCGTSQVCQASQCRCQDGTTTCGGSCVVTEYDTQNCGACGKRCAGTEVCENSTCKTACTIGSSVLCGSSCVNAASDVNNCGACGVTCQSGQSCRNGACTFEVVAACLTSGEIAGFKAATGEKGPPADLGTQPEALASMQGRVLSADGTDNRLYQAVLPSGSATYQQAARSNRTGSVPNQVLVDGTTVYIVNAASGTLQVLQQGSGVSSDVFISDAGATGEVPLVTVAELPLGMNTYPQGIAKVGSSLWVPLYGGFGSGPEVSAGQKVLEISVADARAPAVTHTVDLAGLDLKSFDGGVTLPRPWAITAHRGAVYAVLNNFDLAYHPAGPGFLARIDPTTRAVTLVNLGAQTCRNPQWAAETAAGGLVVSCVGEARYTGPFNALQGSEHGGLVMLNAADQVTATWPSPLCELDAGTGCLPVLPGRLAVTQNRVFLADQNGGRVLAFGIADGGFTAERTIQACTLSTVTGLANVADLLVTP